MSLLPFGTSADLASLILRLVVGALFIVHGWPKVKNLKGTADWIRGTGWTWAAGFAYAFGPLELLGGIAFLAGLLTRIVAILFVLEMIGTTIFARAKLGKKLVGGYEMDLLYLAGALAVAVLGAGAWSLDAILGL